MMRIGVIILVCSLLCLQGNLQAQRIMPQVIPSLGASAVAGGIQFSYTVGEPGVGPYTGYATPTIGAQQYGLLLPPVAPAGKVACKDTIGAFVFDSIKAGFGGNKIEWALNSSFAGSAIINSLTAISLIDTTLGIDTIWIRTKAGTTGEVSSAVITTIRIDSLPTNITPSFTDSLLCNGSMAIVNIADSRSMVEYFLQANSSIIDSVTGTGGVVQLNSGTVTAGSVYKIIATDNSTQCTAIGTRWRWHWRIVGGHQSVTWLY